MRSTMTDIMNFAKDKIIKITPHFIISSMELPYIFLNKSSTYYEGFVNVFS
jgi:hypothetical protein